MSTVCYCGRPDCSVTSLARDACLTALRTERDALKAQVLSLKADVEAVEAMRQDTARRLEAAVQMHRQAEAERDKLKQERDSFKAVYEAAKRQVRDEIQRAGETADRICKERDAYLADREALRAQVAEFKRLRQVWLMSPEAAERLDAYRELAQKCAQMEARVAALEGSKAIEDDFDELRAERDSLRAQVEAARRRCRDRLDYGEDETVFAQDILDAMDEAAK